MKGKVEMCTCVHMCSLIRQLDRLYSSKTETKWKQIQHFSTIASFHSSRAERIAPGDKGAGEDLRRSEVPGGHALRTGERQGAVQVKGRGGSGFFDERGRGGRTVNAHCQAERVFLFLLIVILKDQVCNIG